MVIDELFDEALPFQENRAAVRIREVRGFIDTDGNMIVDSQYQEVEDFRLGLARIYVINDEGVRAASTAADSRCGFPRTDTYTPRKAARAAQ